MFRSNVALWVSGKGLKRDAKATSARCRVVQEKLTKTKKLFFKTELRKTIERCPLAYQSRSCMKQRDTS
ncbi:hypothetical protein Q5P01_024573 [Channa striata]|uniref:Uncharacterized protein n=1 Tax=Channa striata TaxID=64152 RepID=A0AA88LN28_CHASR|nr:hypothetical protein Q5P01_024573 [Channa striata]